VGVCVIVGKLAQVNHRTLKLSQISYVLVSSVMGECIIVDKHKHRTIIRAMACVTPTSVVYDPASYVCFHDKEPPDLWNMYSVDFCVP